MKGNAGEIIDIEGTTMVDGVSVDILLRINTVQLIHRLGGKAVLNRSRKARIFSGMVVAEADKEKSQAIREARAIKRAQQRAALRRPDLPAPVPTLAMTPAE